MQDACAQLVIATDFKGSDPDLSLSGMIGGLRYHPISTRVNNPGNEGAVLVKAIKL